MRQAVRVEWRKLWRSTVTRTTTALVVITIPVMSVVLYNVAVNGAVGVVGLKASLLVDGEGWPAYLGLVDQITSAAFFVAAGVVVAWVFGREHSDRTFSSLFALATPRSSIAAAKFLVVGVWIVACSIALVASTVGVGLVAGAIVEGGGPGTGWLQLAGVAVFTGALATTVAYVASAGRGYLPAIGALIMIIAAAQILVALGSGGWFPYAVPGLIAVGGNTIPTPTPAQIVLACILVAAGIALTVRWWHYAEVT